MKMILAMAPGVALLLFAGAVIFDAVPPLIVTNTPAGKSMPEGRYVYAHPLPAKVGDVVAIKHAQRYGFRHDVLIKRVVAVTGQEFCWRPDLGTHTIDGKPMPAPAPEVAALGLKPWTGCRKLASDEIVGYGEDSPGYRSFNVSAYVGPLRFGDLWGVYREPAS